MERKTAEERYNDLKKRGRWFWTEEMIPSDLYSDETKEVLDTNSEFIEILEESNSENLVDDLLSSDTIPPALMVQHAMLATSIGKETLDRVADFLQFHNIDSLTTTANGPTLNYELQQLGSKYDMNSISNSDLNSNDRGLLRDIFTILCFGEYISEFEQYPTFDRCILGTICGDEKAIANYFADLYILFSNQTQGRINVKKGAIAENVAGESIEQVVEDKNSLSYAAESRVPDVPEEGDSQEFDFVLKTDGSDTSPTYVAIECAFQETTNSVIERKARQSRELYPAFKQQGHHLCYVVDGAGYFKRSAALKQMLKYSDEAVGFNDLDRLNTYLREVASN